MGVKNKVVPGQKSLPTFKKYLTICPLLFGFLSLVVPGPAHFFGTKPGKSPLLK